MRSRELRCPCATDNKEMGSLKFYMRTGRAAGKKDMGCFLEQGTEIQDCRESNLLCLWILGHHLHSWAFSYVIIRINSGGGVVSIHSAL